MGTHVQSDGVRKRPQNAAKSPLPQNLNILSMNSSEAPPGTAGNLSLHEHSLVELRHGHLSLHTRACQPCPELDDCNVGARLSSPRLHSETGPTQQGHRSPCQCTATGEFYGPEQDHGKLSLCTTTEMSTLRKDARPLPRRRSLLCLWAVVHLVDLLLPDDCGRLSVLVRTSASLVPQPSRLPSVHAATWNGGAAPFGGGPIMATRTRKRLSQTLGGGGGVVVGVWVCGWVCGGEVCVCEGVKV